MTIASSYEQVTYNGPVGAQMGRTRSCPQAFWGATPTSQPTYIASIPTAAISVSGVIGFSTSAAFASMLTALNGIIAALAAAGIIAAS